MTTLLLVRHGDNDWIGKRLSGRLAGVHLNEKGRGEAEALAQTLAALPLQALYSSPLERALETAEPTARRTGLAVQPSDLLQEVDFGQLAGETFDRLRALPIWKQVHTQPGAVRFPGGESLPEVQQRAVCAAEEIFSRHPQGAVAAFSHSDTIRLAMAYFLQMPFESFHTLVIDPGSISLIYHSPAVVKVLGLNLPPGSPVVIREE